MNINYLRAFTDNYMWFIQHEQQIVMVDPGESASIMQYLRDHQLNLQAILLTHDHRDHVGGLEDLLRYKSVPVYGQCRFADHPDITFSLWNNVHCQVITTPGHTEKSVCYWIKTQNTSHLFCGDTLFSAGCGRVFTGDYEAMFQSLQKLHALDDNGLVYPGHEYTLKNLAFALWLEPDNIVIQTQKETMEQRYQEIHCTLPSQLNIEKKINPFLRCEDPSIIHAVSQKIGRTVTAGLDCFTQLRQLKDDF